MNANPQKEKYSDETNKKVKKFYACLIDKGTKQTIKKFSFNIEISLPHNTELVVKKKKSKDKSKDVEVKVEQSSDKIPGPFDSDEFW